MIKEAIDIIIIGAGIIGCAIARELSRYDASVVVLESASDVAEGATKANSGIIHTGYDALPGTRKAYYNVIGKGMYPKLCEDLGVSYRQCGALVVGFDERDRKTLENLHSRGNQNGVRGLRIIDREGVLSLEPHVNPEVTCALLVPDSAIVSPYEIAYALADDAAANGVTFVFGERVDKVTRGADGRFLVKSSKVEYTGKAIINCAGSSGADIHNQLSDSALTMIHRRGQYFLLDRAESQPFSRTIFQCPSSMGKGVLITPTVHGNLLIGPTAEDVIDPIDTSTTKKGLSDVLAMAKHIWPQISVRTNITNFSGVRAHLESGDFVVGEVDDMPGVFEAIGIESPGLSSAPAIAAEIRDGVAEYLGIQRKKAIVHYHRDAKSFRDRTDQEREKAVGENGLHGNIVCRCEVVTEAEIREAIRRPVGVKTIDAVKRRTRAGMGRCQGGFCLSKVAAIIAEETGKSVLDITKNGGNSYLLVGTVAGFLKGEGGE